MSIIGLICEYNPFHYGHIHHIEEIKKRYPDSILILVLNGYFTQRGDISLLTKEDKTRISLHYGIDLVLELPTFYGTQGSDYFAYGAITILNAIGAQIIVCGSETMNLSYLKEIAQMQINKDSIDTKSFESYPKRLNHSLDILTPFKSNDLLIISYYKIILNYHYSIQLEGIQRTSDYLDTTSNAPIISASNIREKFKNHIPLDSYLPTEVLRNLKQIDEQKVLDLLTYQVLLNPHINHYMDVNEGLDYKIRKEISKSHSLSELILNIKSKRYTYNRIHRMLCHILLGIEKEQIPITYIHVLGFNKNGRSYLKNNKGKFLFPIAVDFQSKLYKIEICSSKIYDIIMERNTFFFEKRNQPIYYTDSNKLSNQK